MEGYTQYIWILWDLAAVALLAGCVWSSAVRGFIRTLIRLIGYVAAVAVARIVSHILAGTVYDAIVKDALRVMLVGRLEELIAQGGAAAGELMDQIPGGLQRIMDGDLLDTIGLSDGTGAVMEAEATRLVETLIDVALRDPIVSILQGLFFLLVFTFASLLVRYLSGMFRGVYKIPVIGTVNTVLGGAVGALQGCLLLFVGAMALQLIILLTGGGFSWLNANVMDDTYVLRVFYNLFTL